MGHLPKPQLKDARQVTNTSLGSHCVVTVWSLAKASGGGRFFPICFVKFNHLDA